MVGEVPVENKTFPTNPTKSSYQESNVKPAINKNYSINPLFNAPRLQTIKINNQNITKKSTENILNKGGEFALHQIFQHRRQSINLNRLDVNNTFSIISIKSAEIESFRQKEDIQNEDVSHVMTEEEEKNLRKALSNHFVFRDITAEVLDSCIKQCIFCTFRKNKIIYHEGEEGNFFYVIAKGSIEATEKKKFKKKYQKWD